MEWECSLFRVIRNVFITLFLVFFGAHSPMAASVPITVEEDLSGVPVVGPLISGALGGLITRRNTCDPEFWDVLKDRAWEEGQREITQNNNLIARPDSVLSMSCFDSFLNNLANHSKDNFPGDPNSFEGGINDLFTRILITDFDELKYNEAGAGDPITAVRPNGYLMYAVLELLVFDQLMPVTKPILIGTQDDAHRVGDWVSFPLMSGVCGIAGVPQKEFYIQDNFPNLMIGGRAVAETGPPAWTAIQASLGGGVTETGFNGCAKMNNVWTRSKCYDFATESARDISPPAADPAFTPGPIPTRNRHDAFYTMTNYKDLAAGSRDFRTKDSECPPPPTDGLPVLPSGAEYACDLIVHGFPTSTGGAAALATIIGLLTAGTPPTWATAYLGANPLPNATPAVSNGGVDQYTHYLGLRDSTSCASLTPIKTGYIVVDSATTNKYVDAVCPAPGCFFNPPATIAANGSCVQP